MYKSRCDQLLCAFDKWFVERY